MNIPETLIESAINPKDIRPHLCAPYLDVHGRRLIATDGLVAAVVPVMVTADDHAGSVPLEVFKRGRKMMGTDCCENAVTLNGSARLIDGTQLPRPEYDSRSESVASAVDGMLARGRNGTNRSKSALSLSSRWRMSRTPSPAFTASAASYSSAA